MTAFVQCSLRACRRQVIFAYAHEPKAWPIETNRFGFVCGRFTALQIVKMPDAHRLIYHSVAGGKDNHNQYVGHDGHPLALFHPAASIAETARKCGPKAPPAVQGWN
jgi:hypothetical protein